MGLPYILDGVRYAGGGVKIRGVKVCDCQGFGILLNRNLSCGAGQYDYGDELVNEISDCTVARTLTGIKIDNQVDFMLGGNISIIGSRDYNLDIGAATSSGAGGRIHAWGAGKNNIRIFGSQHDFDYLQADASLGDGMVLGCDSSSIGTAVCQWNKGYGVRVTGNSNVLRHVNAYRPQAGCPGMLSIEGTFNRILTSNIDAGESCGASVFGNHTSLRGTMIHCSSNANCGIKLGTEAKPISFCRVDATVANWRAGGSQAPACDLHLGEQNSITIRHHGWAKPFSGTDSNGVRGNAVKFVEF